MDDKREREEGRRGKEVACGVHHAAPAVNTGL
jgi:hypothetical protein